MVFFVVVHREVFVKITTNQPGKKDEAENLQIVRKIENLIHYKPHCHGLLVPLLSLLCVGLVPPNFSVKGIDLFKIYYLRSKLINASIVHTYMQVKLHAD
jgi:hypothetical protein